MDSQTITYIIKLQVYLSLGGLIYFVLLRNVNLPTLKRYFLLFLGIGVFVAPLIEFPQADSSTMYQQLLNTFSVGNEPTASAALNFEWMKFAALFYGIICITLLIKPILGLKQLRQMQKSAEKIYDGRYTLFIHPSFSQPCSFGNAIYLPSYPASDDILIHEKQHIDCKHSIDKIIIIAVRALNWINPLSYFLYNWMEENHEYQVDQLVLDKGISLNLYKNTLVAQALTGSGLQLIHSFSQVKILKTRIHMMTTKTNKTDYLKAFTAIGVALFAFVSIQANTGQSISNTAKSSAINFSQDTVMSPEKAAEYPGGPAEMMKFLSKNITFPKAAKEGKQGGTVYVSFVINKNGKVVNTKIARGVSAEIDQEAMRVVNLMPKWKPAMDGGKNVNSQFNLPIKFVYD